MKSFEKPWLTIWLKPRATMRLILENDPRRMVLTLSMLWGVSVSIDTAILKNHGDLFTVPLILALAGIFGPSAGIVILYVMGFYFAWVGRLFGGRGEARELRAAFAWSSIPNVISLLLLLPAIFFFGNDLFTSDTPHIDSHPFLFFLLVIYILVSVVLYCWAITMFIKCVAEAHRFSCWRALLVVGSWPALLTAVVLAGYLVDQ